MKRFVLIYLMFSLLSCTNKSNEFNFTNKYTLINKDTVNFKVPDTINHPDSQKLKKWNFNDDSISFLFENNDNLKLSSVKFKSKQWENNIIQKYAINGVKTIGDFKIIKNKIIYIPSYQNRVLVLDSLSNILKSYDFSINYTTVISRLEVDYKNDTILFPILNTKSSISPNTFIKSKLVGQVSETISNELCDTPNDYYEYHQQGNINQLIGNFVFLPNKIVYDFKKSPHIYVYNKATQKTKTFNCENPYIKVQKNIKNDVLKNELEGQYKVLLFDKWNNVFYRISATYDSDKIRLQNSLKNARKLHIDILDNKFQRLGFMSFVGLSENHYFINKEGLFLRLYSDNENDFKFVKLRLEKVN